MTAMQFRQRTRCQKAASDDPARGLGGGALELVNLMYVGRRSPVSVSDHRTASRNVRVEKAESETLTCSMSSLGHESSNQHRVKVMCRPLSHQVTNRVGLNCSLLPLFLGVRNCPDRVIPCVIFPRLSKPLSLRFRIYKLATPC